MELTSTYVQPSKSALRSDILTTLQTASMRVQLAARIERTTHLETRLLATLDALDDLRAVSAAEVEKLTQENYRLKWKAAERDRAFEQVRNEKEDMQEVVLQLVEKGRCRRSR